MSYSLARMNLADGQINMVNVYRAIEDKPSREASLLGSGIRFAESVFGCDPGSKEHLQGETFWN
jgi:hypothetical protein